MKTRISARLALLTLLMAAGIIAGRAEPVRTDINPALLYYRASQLAPDLSQADRDYLFTKDWQGQKLPERFGELIVKYNNELSLVRQAAKATSPCDWGVDWSPGPATLLPHLGRNKGIAEAARLHAMWLLQNGQHLEASDDLLAVLALGRNSSRDGSLISVLVEMAIENIVYSTVAENFFKFPPETLKRLVAGFDAVPARGTVAFCIQTEKATFLGWIVDKIRELQKENPGNDARVIATLHELCAFMDAPGEGRTNQAPSHLWEDLMKLAGGTSEGIIRLARDAESLYPRVAEILALPRGQREAAIKQFSADARKSPNPFVSQTFPSWDRCIPKEFAIEAEQSMVRAAVEYKLRGEAGLQSVTDPCGQGPFVFERFVFNGIDRGFELKSAYAGRGFQEVLIFVEKDGPPFRVNGQNAGKASAK